MTADLEKMGRTELLALADEHGIAVNRRLGEVKLRLAIADELPDEDDVDVDEVPAAPAGLEIGGLELWDSVHRAKQLNPGETVVLEEACRIKDRCDLFASLLNGDEYQWAKLRDISDSNRTVLMIDGAVTEARLHAGELRQLIEKLRLPTGTVAPKESDDPLARALAELAAQGREPAAAG